MRRLTALWASTALIGASVGCVGPHSSGAVWAIQNQEAEIAYFGTSDAERQARTRAYELGLADEALTSERQRVDALVQDCPGPRDDVPFSTGDAVRDGIRLRARGDASRLAQVAQLALGDWYARRAAATREAQFCEKAHAALASAAAAQAPQPDALAAIPVSTVSRDPRLPAPAPTSDSALLVLSDYALGFTDSVTAAAPLPQYLALVYGGSLQGASGAGMDAETAASTVDQLAPGYPDWEPDALYAAFKGTQG